MPDTLPPEERFFPAADRVVYRHSPLVEVICQLRYPTILRIESEIPADFQEAIRDQFPLVERKIPDHLAGLPPELARMVGVAAQQDIQYDFKSEDGAHIIGLGPTFVALTSRTYGQWEEFVGRLRPSIAAIESIYKPSFYNRIGLRYRNQIDRNKIGLAPEPWSTLLSKNIVGELSSSGIDGVNVLEVSHHVRVRFDGSGVALLLQHGLGPIDATGQSPYVIDVDMYFEQRTEVQDEFARLDHLHALAGRVFRWCITDRLHEALGPGSVRLDDKHG